MSQVTLRDLFSVDAICCRPGGLRKEKGAEKAIEKRNVHGEVLIYCCRIRTVMPMMESRSCKERIKPAEVKTHIGVNENGVKGHEHQVSEVAESPNPRR